MTGPLRTIAVLAAATGDALLNTLAGSRRHRPAPSAPPASQLVVFEIIGRECADRTIGQRDLVNGDIAHWNLAHWNLAHWNLTHWNIEHGGIDDHDPENRGYNTAVD